MKSQVAQAQARAFARLIDARSSKQKSNQQTSVQARTKNGHSERTCRVLMTSQQRAQLWQTSSVWGVMR
jgi:hypothetical protein